MTSRKIIANLLLGLLGPIMLNVRALPQVYRAIFYGEYTYLDFGIQSLEEYLSAVCSSFFFFFFLFLILLPFQLIKDYYSRNGRKIVLFKKFLILAGIMIFWSCFFGIFVNLWVISWYDNYFYLVKVAVFGTVFTVLCYLFIDRYET